jgi:penicillin-binding protein 1C
LGSIDKQNMQWNYPRNKQVIFIGRGIDGTKGEFVAELTHRQKNIRVFWHLNKRYVGETMEIHQMNLALEKGKNHLTAVDEFGNRCAVEFMVK